MKRTIVFKKKYAPFIVEFVITETEITANAFRSDGLGKQMSVRIR
jgi:hypothetical protein